MAARARADEPDDREAERLLVEAAQRDPARYAALYEAQFDTVYAYVARRVPDRAEAEDLTAEVFRKALEAIGRFEWRGAPLAAWLLRIAANALADRARRAMHVVVSSQAVEEATTVDPEASGSAYLFRLVRELPDDQRRVVELRFAEERSVKEIAAELGRTEGAVKQLQLRALTTLRKRMQRKDA
jgi:RNA polymerase sigma-70 factor (ECF subfamily)